MKRPLLIAFVLLALLILLYFARADEVDVCGNDKKEGDEDCDGIDDAKCPEACSPLCRCPPPEARSRLEPSRHTFSYDTIERNVVNTVNLDLPEVGFQALTFAFNQTVSDVTLIIDANTSAPALGRLPDGVVYQYFRFFLQNDSQMRHMYFAQVFFRVPNAWIINNNIESISLQRRVTGEPWSKVLAIDKIYSDAAHTYFFARPEKPDVFAIVGKERIVPVIRPVCGNGILESGEDSETCCADAGCPQGLSCIANKCREVAICGNNVCESAETVESCPLDCAKKLFAPATPTLITLLTVALIAALMFLGKRVPRKQAKTKRERVTPRRWF